LTHASPTRSACGFHVRELLARRAPTDAQVVAKSKLARKDVDHSRKALAKILHPEASDAYSSFSFDAHNCADGKTSHMFLRKNLECTYLHASACKYAQLQEEILFD
jgi:tRNA(Glu) U13 pseudouridine synthase TruD